MSGRDRLELIALLAQIADTGSLSKAAERAEMSQPSASRLLKHLETIVQVRLVERSTRELALTPAGLRFLSATRGMVATWQGAMEDLRREREELEGHLRVVAPVVAGQELMASIVARFVRRHPAVTIEWRLSDAAADPTPEADLWIRIGELLPDTLIRRDVWRIGCAVIGGPEHPPIVHPKELADRAAIRIVTCVPELVELSRADGDRYNLRQPTTFIVDNLFAARAALREGVGYAIMPLWAVQADLRRGVLTRLCPDWVPPPVVLSLAYPPGGHRPRRLVALLKFIRSELTREGGLGIAFMDAADANGSILTLPA